MKESGCWDTIKVIEESNYYFGWFVQSPGTGLANACHCDDFIALEFKFIQDDPRRIIGSPFNATCSRRGHYYFMVIRKIMSAS